MEFFSSFFQHRNCHIGARRYLHSTHCTLLWTVYFPRDDQNSERGDRFSAIRKSIFPSSSPTSTTWGALSELCEPVGASVYTLASPGGSQSLATLPSNLSWILQPTPHNSLLRPRTIPQTTLRTQQTLQPPSNPRTLPPSPRRSDHTNHKVLMPYNLAASGRGRRMEVHRVLVVGMVQTRQH